MSTSCPLVVWAPWASRGWPGWDSRGTTPAAADQAGHLAFVSCPPGGCAREIEAGVPGWGDEPGKRSGGAGQGEAQATVGSESGSSCSSSARKACPAAVGEGQDT